MLALLGRWMHHPAAMSGPPGPPPPRADDSDTNFNVLLIGDAGVGKTSILLRYMTGQFDGTPSVTLGTDSVRCGAAQGHDPAGPPHGAALLMALRTDGEGGDGGPHQHHPHAVVRVEGEVMRDQGLCADRVRSHTRACAGAETGTRLGRSGTAPSRPPSTAMRMPSSLCTLSTSRYVRS